MSENSVKIPFFSKKGQKFIPFLKIFLLPSSKILGEPLGRIDIFARAPRTTQPCCPILKNKNITGRDLPCTTEHLGRTLDIMVIGHH